MKSEIRWTISRLYSCQKDVRGIDLHQEDSFQLSWTLFRHTMENPHH